MFMATVFRESGGAIKQQSEALLSVQLWTVSSGLLGGERTGMNGRRESSPLSAAEDYQRK